MVQIVCPCLNVRVHGKGSTLEIRDVSSLNLSENASADEFFASRLYEVLLDLGGVTKAQKTLCTSRCIDGWVITSCFGCESDIYAKHLDDNDRVLVNANMEKDAAKITTMMESENYSAVFKLILPEMNDNFVQNNFGIDFVSARVNLEHAFESVQQQVSTYLKEEQKIMEERIRLYSEQQQTRYAALQQKVRKHRHAMVYLLFKKKGNKKSHSDDMIEGLSPLASPVSPIHPCSDDSSSSTDSALTRSECTDNQREVVVKQRIPPLQRCHSTNNPSHGRNMGFRQEKHVAQSVIDGDVFEMEILDNHYDTSSFESSDDDTDGSNAAENNRTNLHHDEDSQNSVYAKSLPISVPAWTRYSQNPEFEEEEKVHFGDPGDIAASIRALAQSVRDGTEMFGDLPRRRLNTGDLVKSRPI